MSEIALPLPRARRPGWIGLIGSTLLAMLAAWVLTLIGTLAVAPFGDGLYAAATRITAVDRAWPPFVVTNPAGALGQAGAITLVAAIYAWLLWGMLKGEAALLWCFAAALAGWGSATLMDPPNGLVGVLVAVVALRYCAYDSAGAPRPSPLPRRPEKELIFAGLLLVALAAAGGRAWADPIQFDPESEVQLLQADRRDPFPSLVFGVESSRDVELTSAELIGSTGARVRALRRVYGRSAAAKPIAVPGDDDRSRTLEVAFTGRCRGLSAPGEPIRVRLAFDSGASVVELPNHCL